MRILDRYIAKTLFRGFSVVLLVLTSLFSFLVFVRELDEVGNNNYRLLDAAFYVALTLPQRVLDLAPITVLLGGLLGLGRLARGNELVPMLTAGLSLRRFAWSVGKAAIILTICCALFSQFVAPPMQQLAKERRINSTVTGTSLVKKNGLWSRDGHQVLHVRHMWKGQIPYQVELYDFDSSGRLNRYLQAARADVLDENHWKLVNVRQKNFVDHTIIRTSHKKMIWRSFLGRRQLEELQLPANSLSPLSLYEYIRYLKETRQSTKQFELLLWRKLFMPLNVGAMTMLAIPFVFIRLRRNLIGSPLALGTGIGMLLFVLNQILPTIASNTSFSAPLISALPLVAIAIVTGTLFWWVSRKGVI